MKFSLYIANRLGLRSSDDHSGSPGVVVGYIGVSLAILIMLLSIFVVSGFKREINEKLVGLNANVSLHAKGGDDNPAFTSGCRLTDSLTTIIKSVAPQAEVSLSICQPAIFKTSDDFQGLILKGMDRESSEWDFISRNMIDGAVPADSMGNNIVIISEATATKLNVGVGDKIDTHFLDGENVRTRRLQIEGIYNTHFEHFDNNYALTRIEMLQQLNKVDSLTGTIIDLRKIDIPESGDVANRLYQLLLNHTIEHPENPMLFNISTIDDTCSQYLNWLKLLDTNVVVIIILMALVAAFTLISSLFIIILERVGMIGLLKALGATNLQIRRIFIFMALKLVITGLAIGNILAIAIGYLQQTYHLIPLSAESYYLTYVPMDIRWQDILIVDIAAVGVAALVLILPSQLVAGMSPSKTLRYE